MLRLTGYFQISVHCVLCRQSQVQRLLCLSKKCDRNTGIRERRPRFHSWSHHLPPDGYVVSLQTPSASSTFHLHSLWAFQIGVSFLLLSIFPGFLKVYGHWEDFYSCLWCVCVFSRSATEHCVLSLPSYISQNSVFWSINYNIAFSSQFCWKNQIP